MTKKLLALLTICALSCAAYSYSRQNGNFRPRGKEGGMMLDLQKFNLGTLNNVEDKKQYLSIIQLEKQRIQNFSLKMVYEDAYIFYRKKDYQRALEMAEAVLAIDPNYVPARTLADQAYMMGAYGTISEAEIIDSKIEEGKRLYNAGRLMEAQRKFEEILTIQPHNTTAQSWIKRISAEIADEHERRGDEFYEKLAYEAALDQWYNALLIRRKDSSLVNKISHVEGEWQAKQVTRLMQEGMNAYSGGKYIASYEAFQKVLKIHPGEERATKFSAQIREELAGGYYASCQKAYNAAKYENAITNCQEAKKWGYSSAAADSLIAKARKAMNATNAKTAAAAAAKAANASGKPGETITTSTINASGGFDINNPAAGGAAGLEGNVNAIPGTTSGGINNNLPGSAAARVTAEQAQASQDAYRRGLAAYNERDFITARREFTQAVNLDPANTNAEAGLRRIDEQEGK